MSPQSTSIKNCFVVMPFRQDLDEVYQLAIKPAIIDSGLVPWRADEMIEKGSPIVSQSLNAIESTDLILADLTGHNPNVFFELGVAKALGKPVVLISQDIEDVPFDLLHLRILKYQPDAGVIARLRLRF